jgi:CheY-like chemotaxis protein
MNILYVEDNRDAVSTTQRITTHFRHQLLVAETIAGGLALLDARPDLVLLDMLLPDGDAIQFLHEARKRFATLPIIVLTGYAIDGEQEKCFAAGCTDYFIKPMDVKTLIALFQRYSLDALK